MMPSDPRPAPRDETGGTWDPAADGSFRPRRGVKITLVVVLSVAALVSLILMCVLLGRVGGLLLPGG
jgi:hypothetical protein